MARIVALDFGKKRTGIAVTDPSQIIATALDTVDTGELIGLKKKDREQKELIDSVSAVILLQEYIQSQI